MYMVCSRWEVLPGREADWEVRGRAVRTLMRSQPGVRLIESFKSEDGGLIAIVGYDSKEAYEKIVGPSNGAFQKAIEEHRLEEVARWISSDRGETID